MADKHTNILEANKALYTIDLNIDGLLSKEELAGSDIVNTQKVDAIPMLRDKTYEATNSIHKDHNSKARTIETQSGVGVQSKEAKGTKTLVASTAEHASKTIANDYIFTSKSKSGASIKEREHKIGLLLCHSHIELRLWLRLILRLRLI